MKTEGVILGLKRREDMATKTAKKTKGTKKPVTRAKKTTRGKVKTASVNFQERIKDRAYDLFSKRGFLHGNDVSDWTLAQDLIELENKAASSKKLRKAAVRPQKLKEEIEERAHELYEYRGRAHGNDVFDWSLAEEITFLRSNIL